MSFLQNRKIILLSVVNSSQYFYNKDKLLALSLRVFTHKTSHVTLVLCVPLVAGYIKHLTANFPAGDYASLVQASDLLGLVRGESADRAFSCHEVLTPPDKCGRQ